MPLPRPARPSGWRAHALLLLVFALLAAPLVTYRAVADTPLSIYDEWQYADRVHAVSEGHLFMRDGEDVTYWGEVARACRGVERVMPPSDCVPTPGNLESATPNYAAVDPPAYFWATGLGAAVLERTGVADDTVVAGRLVGIVWAALSMWSLWVLARALGATRAASAVAASTVVLVPAFLHQYSHITPHALDIPVGAFTTLAVVRAMQGRWPWWVLPLAALGIVGVKGSNIVVAVAVGVALAAVVVWPGTFDRRQRLRAVLVGAVLAVSTLAAFAALRALLSATRVADYAPPGHFVVADLNWHAVAIDSIKFITPWGEGPLVAVNVWLMMAMTGTALVVWAGLVDGLPPYVRQLAPGFLLGAASGAVVLDLMVFLTTGQYFSVLLRYGLALFPLGLALAALLLRTRTAVVLSALLLASYAALPFVLALDTVAA